MNIEYSDLKTPIRDFIEGFREGASIVDPLNYLLINTQSQQMDIFCQHGQHMRLNEQDLVRKSRATLLVMMIFQRLPQLTVSHNEFILLSTFFIGLFHRPETCNESSNIVSMLFQRQIRQSMSYSGVIDRFLLELKSDSFYVPSYPQEVRINVYRMLRMYKFVVDEQGDYIKSLGADFVSIVLKVSENEMDPRNILLVFELIKFLLWDLDASILRNYATTIFEQLDCYYPIEFNETADKRFSIKQLQLADGLNACLSSPLLLSQVVLSLEEKLSSSFHQAQLASMQTIQHIYTLNEVVDEQISNKIWGILELYLEHLIEMEFEKDYVKAVRGVLSRANHLVKRITHYLVQTLQDKPLSINASLSLSCLREAQTITPEMNLVVESLMFKQFVARASFKDEAVAEKQISNILLVVQQSLKGGDVSHDEALMKNVIMTLQEAVMCGLENCIVLALKTLIELYGLIEDKALYDSINTTILEMLKCNQSTIIRKCCIDFIGCIPQHDLTSIWQFFEESTTLLTPELQNYSKPILFHLFPQMYIDHKNQLESLLHHHQIDEQRHLVPILKFITLHHPQDYHFYFTLFLRQPNTSHKQAQKAIVKALLLPSTKLASSDTLWVLQHLNKASILLVVVDALQQDISEFGQQIHSHYCQLKFDQDHVHDPVNSKNFCKLLKRIVPLYDLELPPQPRDIYTSHSSNGISQFDCFCMIMRVGAQLLHNRPQCWTLIENEIVSGMEVDQYLIDLLCGVISHKDKMSPTQWTLVMDRIILPSLDLQASPKQHSLIVRLLIKVDPDVVRQYKQYWQVFLDVLKSQLMAAESTTNMESMINVVLSISSYSQLNVIPLLLDVLKQRDLDVLLMSQILKSVGSNSQLGQSDVELQSLVIQTFKGYLDHKKRLVRKSAQFGINSWFMIGSKGM